MRYFMLRWPLMEENDGSSGGGSGSESGSGQDSTGTGASGSGAGAGSGSGSGAGTSAEKERLEALLATERSRGASLQAQLEKEQREKTRLQEAADTAERKRLEEEGNFKELAKVADNQRQAAEDRATAAEKSVAQIAIDSELRVALILEGATDLDIATLLDRSSIRYEGGKVVGVTEAVKAYKETKPHFFTAPPERPASTSRTALNPQGKTQDPTKKIDVTKMSPEEYAKHRKQTLRGLRGGRAA